MTATTVTVHRVATAIEASSLVGGRVPPNPGLLLPSPAEGDTVMVHDADTTECIAIISRLDRARRERLRAAVLSIEMAAVARMSGKAGGRRGQDGKGRTFGWSPKRVMNHRESCRPTTTSEQHPAQHAVLTQFAGYFSAQFHELLPPRAAADVEVFTRRIASEWAMEPHALWTSGVINKAAQLPYHRDSANLHTWSVMPTLRYKMRGGLLHLPEYNMAFPCADGDVSWFCGKDLVHGVTPMTAPTEQAYRFSVVYYATATMANCASIAEETRAAAARRTVREREMARVLTSRLAGDR